MHAYLLERFGQNFWSILFMQASHLVLQVAQSGASALGRLCPRHEGISLWQSKQAAVQLAQAAAPAEFALAQIESPYFAQ